VHPAVDRVSSQLSRRVRLWHQNPDDTEASREREKASSLWSLTLPATFLERNHFRRSDVMIKQYRPPSNPVFAARYERVGNIH